MLASLEGIDSLRVPLIGRFLKEGPGSERSYTKVGTALLSAAEDTFVWVFVFKLQ